MLELNKIYNEDCIDTMANMDDDFIDLTITSPPYNVNLGHNKLTSYDIYNDNKGYKEYITWLSRIFKQIYLKTKKGGRCVINIGDGQNGKIPTHSDVIQEMVTIGWIPLATIIWDKKSTSNRAAWGSFASPSCPSFPTPFEYILCFAKEQIKLQWQGETDLDKKEFISWSSAIWNFSGQNPHTTGHPSAFPIELPIRCIKMFSWIGSVVYDPFIGCGTTAVAAKLFNRNYIGSEISQHYVKLATERLRQNYLF